MLHFAIEVMLTIMFIVANTFCHTLCLNHSYLNDVEHTMYAVTDKFVLWVAGVGWVAGWCWVVEFVTLF